MKNVYRVGMGACALAIAAVTPVRSQVSPLGPGAFNLPRSDLELLGAAETKLYEDPATKVGASGTWQNPKTGNSGTVTLISTFERDGQPCRRVSHGIKARGIQGTRQFVISRCRATDGGWKIVP